MKINIQSAFIILSLMVMACSGQNKAQSSNTVKAYQEIAETKLESKAINYLANADSSLMLCQSEQKGTAQMPQNQINYLVVEQNSGAILVEGSVHRGSVKWYDAENLEIFRIPGIIAQDQTADDYTEIFNVKTKKSVLKSSLKK